MINAVPNIVQNNKLKILNQTVVVKHVNLAHFDISQGHLPPPRGSQGQPISSISSKSKSMSYKRRSKKNYTIDI